MAVTKKSRVKPDAGETVELPAMNLKFMNLTVVGDSGLISHAWSEKAKKQIKAKQAKEARTAREARNPEQEFKDSLYIDSKGRYAFPAVAFKSAATDACSHVAGVTKVEARGAFHIVGDLVPIDGKPEMRDDMVRIAMGTADIRYRGEYKTWSATMQIRYNENVLSAAQIVNLFNVGGFAIGVGEWRPQKDGSHGMFHVKDGVN